MKTKHTIFFLLLTLSLTTSCADTAQTDLLLDRLDRVIEEKEVYLAGYRHRMDSIKTLARQTADDTERWKHYKTLYLNYSTHNIDTVTAYVAKMQALAQKMNNPDMMFQSEVARVMAHHAMFEYEVGRRLFESLDTTRVSVESLTEYWSCGSRLYRDCLRYTECSDEEREEYTEKLKLCREDMMERGFYISRDCRLKTALMHIDNGEWENAHRVLDNVMREEDLSQTDIAVTSYYISKAYRLTGDTEKRKEFLIRAATTDLQIPIRESFSMWELSQLLFQERDYARASRYMTLTLNEALACNFRILYMRAIDAREIIAQTVYEQQKVINRILIFIIVLVLIALGIISVMFAHSNHQRRRIAKANALIKSMNRNLERVNSELKDANHIKDNYVSLYMKLSTYYIRQVDEERSSLRKIAKTEGMDGIMKVLRSPKYADSEYKKFYHTFDTTFMSLFPHFVEKVNEMLPEDARLETKNNGGLTTELRILAVIRLGIVKSQEIADVLNCAIRTVYKYRITLRSVALCPKDEFEERIKQIDI